ncbi:MAG: AAA family ATPase [Gemmatimonadetes bacterium]|nr:AAA family ATPase [Gemmatimonadota bacterium]
MKLTLFAANNFKSLRGIRVVPDDLSVVVGANAAGKSNLADAFDFLSEIYRHGLEVAVARKGGYENIAFRRMRRSKGSISLELAIEVTSEEARVALPNRMRLPDMQFTHRFSFAAHGYSIRAEFSVASEVLDIRVRVGDSWRRMTTVTRAEDNSIKIDTPAPDSGERTIDRELERFLEFSDLRYLVSKKQTLAPTELFVSSVGRYTLGLHSFVTGASRIRVFRINPSNTREFGVPTPRPELDSSGQNLPAVVDLLKKDNPDQWKLVMEAMRAILPDLEQIAVDYTSSRTLGLFFEERGVGRPWSVAEVSDGTIQTLALLIAIFDPRYSALVIEEPENSVHPWIIRHVLNACKQASKKKQILITTHSPIVMNAVSPEQVSVIWRAGGESHLAPLISLDKSFLKLWQEGRLSTFNYLDSGSVLEAIPPVADQLELGGLRS